MKLVSMPKLYLVVNYLFLLLLSLPVSQAYSQERREKIPESLRRRVNSIESFMNRFNFEEDEIGNRKQVSESSSVTESFVQARNHQILSLLDQQRISKAKDKDFVKEFLLDVNSLQKQAKLNFYDKQWFAEVQIQVLYKQKPQQVILILQNEETSPRTSQWVIRGVKADFLTIQPKQPDSLKFIPPNSHGTDFIGVPQNLSDPQWISQFAARDVEIDPLSIFFYAVYSGEITFKQTLRASYHFLQLDHWIMKVEEVNQDSTSAGWLVAELIKAGPEDKSRYARQKLNIR